jgi:hypothetical protein
MEIEFSKLEHILCEDEGFGLRFWILTLLKFGIRLKTIFDYLDFSCL